MFLLKPLFLSFCLFVFIYLYYFIFTFIKKQIKECGVFQPILLGQKGAARTA